MKGVSIMKNQTSVVSGSQYKEIRIKSVWPIWGAVGVWILAGCIMPMHKIAIIILTALCSALVYGFITLVMPKKTIRERIPFTSDDPAMSDVINRIDESMDIISEDSKKIFAVKPDVSDMMNDIVAYILKIREDILASPQKLKKISRFLNYYLPTTVKISEKYVYLTSQHSTGENVTEALSAIEKAFEQVKIAFARQHDALFEGDALDMSTDVEVLETLLKQDALDEQS